MTPDYSESLIRISELRKSAQQALLAKKYAEATIYADQIIANAYALRVYTIANTEQNTIFGTMGDDC